MAYPIQPDVVPGEQYRYALTNFRIAHEKVEEQRLQLQEQEKQVALLREHIALLEGSTNGTSVPKTGNSSVDDFSIKNAASRLERQINRWAADVVRAPPTSLTHLRLAAVQDLLEGADISEETYGHSEASPMQVQCLLRHALSFTISEAIINCLVITNSMEANIQIARIHEQIFARDPTVAAVWRRQTFSAAVESCSDYMSRCFLTEHIPTLTSLLCPENNTQAESMVYPLLKAGYDFSRLLHSAPSSSGGSKDAFYRSFIPELGSVLDPRQIELVKRCIKTESGELDRVGATVFPGLVKVSRGASGPAGQPDENVQTVVRRAQVVCECALGIMHPVH
ncbi:hypothetical protein OBBRIDRAFT_757965 [Obba rivulosa]|uniref:Uncharacterized protein n=1 Tax=Obba rivulosa TaxID=1052685 RepID=A0A8E2AV08_9APHY|nr:hypothetical protein OBBRIDRAFT_757965 [Obba rivulosa]